MRESAEFETAPIQVNAVRLFVDGWYTINGKEKWCVAGMWLVQLAHPKRGSRVTMLCVPDDVFREGYRPTDTASEAMWKERTSKIHPVWPDGKPIDLN